MKKLVAFWLLKHLVTWWLLCLALLGQFAARVQSHDGAVLEALSVGAAPVRGFGLELAIRKVSAERIRVDLWNPGRPEWTVSSPQTGDRVALFGVAVGCPPGWRPEWAAERGFALESYAVDGMDVWRCVSLEQLWPTPPPVPGGQPSGPRRFPLGTSYPYLEGGESFWVDLVPREADGDELEALPPRKGPIVDGLAALAGTKAESVDRYPRLAAHRALWTLDEASYTFRTPPVAQNLGWLLLWNHKRFAANADGSARIPPLTGWYQWGTTGDAADGPTNGRYDPALACLQRYVATGDSGAWRLAYLLARQKVATGLVRTAALEPGVSWRWAYEKGFIASEAVPGVKKGGEIGKVGSGAGPPRYTHEWDAGTLFTLLMADDRPALELMRRRGETLIGADPRWWAYDCRGAGWHVRNLRAYWHGLRDQRFRDEAGRYIRQVFTELRPAEQHFGDRLSGGDWKPWQEFLFCTELMLWMKQEGVATEHFERLRGCARWALDNGLRYQVTPIGKCVQTAVSLGSATTVSTNWGPPALTAFAVPLLSMAAAWEPRYADLHAAAVRTVVGGINQGWSAGATFGVDPLPASERGIAPTGYGFATLKVQLETAYGTSDEWLRLAPEQRR